MMLPEKRMSSTELSNKLYQVISSITEGEKHQAVSTLEELTNDALDWMSTELRAVSSQVALTQLLAELTHQINPKNSQSIFAKFITLVEHNYGTDSLATSDCYTTLAAYFTSQRKLKLALDFCGRALQNRIKNLGPKHQCTADAHYNLGLVYRLMSNLQDSRAQFNLALQLRKELTGDGSDKVAQTEIAIGKCEEMDDNSTLAFLHYSNAHAILKRKFGIGHPLTQQTGVNMQRVRREKENKGQPEGGHDDVLYSKEEVMMALDEIGSTSGTTIEVSQEVMRFASSQRVVSKNELVALCENDADLRTAIIEELDEIVASEATDLMKLSLEEEEARITEKHVSDRRSMDLSDQQQQQQEEEKEEKVVEGTSTQEPSDDAMKAAISSVFRRSSVTQEWEDANVLSKAAKAKPSQKKKTRKPKPPPISSSSSPPSSSPPKRKDTGKKNNKVTNKKKIIPAMFSLDEDGQPRKLAEAESRNAMPLPPPAIDDEADTNEEDSKNEDEDDSDDDEFIPGDPSQLRPRRQSLTEWWQSSPSLGNEIKANIAKDIKEQEGREAKYTQENGDHASLERRETINKEEKAPKIAGGNETNESGKVETQQEAQSSIAQTSTSATELSSADKVDMTTEQKVQYAQYYAQTAVIQEISGNPDRAGTTEWTPEDVQKYQHYYQYYYLHIEQQNKMSREPAGNVTASSTNINGAEKQDKKEDRGVIKVGGRSLSVEELMDIGKKTVLEEQQKSEAQAKKSEAGEKETKIEEGAPPKKSMLPKSPLAALFANRNKVDGDSKKGGEGAPSKPNLPRSPLAAMLAGATLKKGGAKGGFKRPVKKDEPKGPQMKKLHWEVLKSTEDTIWGDIETNEETPETLTELFPDIKDNFEISKIVKKESKEEGKSKKGAKVSLIDGKRSMNMNVMLAQFGKRSMTEIQRILIDMDGESIGIGGITSLLDFVPEMDEIAVVKKYMEVAGNEEENLGKAELYIYHVSKVPLLKQRLLALQCRYTFEDLIGQLEEDIDMVLQAAAEVKNSSRFRALLGIILRLGNELNKGSAKGAAGGFRLGGLIKLTETKTNRGDTLLDYVVQSIMENMRDLFEVVDDFPHINEAARKSFSTLRTSFTKIKGSVTVLEKCLSKLKDEEDNAVNLEKSANINELGKFLDGAKKKTAITEVTFASMESKFKGLCKYLGEDEEGVELVELFGVLSKFTMSLKGAILRVVDAEKRKSAAKKREARDHSSSVGGGSAAPPRAAVTKIGGITMGHSNVSQSRSASKSIASETSTTSGESSNNISGEAGEKKGGRRGRRRE